MKQPALESNRLVVRMPELSDATQIIEYYASNKDHLSQFKSPSPPEFFTESFWSKRINTIHEEFQKDQSFKTIILDKSQPTKIIGVANLFSIIRGCFHAAYLGYSIAKQREGQGLMSEALKNCLIPHAFTELGLHRIMANHEPSNTRSAALLKRLNFNQEGLAKNYLLVHGQWVDHVLTSLTNPKWKVPS